MNRLAKPDYVDNDKIGRMIRLYCKVCGAMIGEYRDGNFIRFKNYAELKMRFKDGVCHVTNLCSKCLGPVSRDPALMLACQRADMDIMIADIPEMARELLRTKPRCMGIDTKRRGIA